MFTSSAQGRKLTTCCDEYGIKILAMRTCLKFHTIVPLNKQDVCQDFGQQGGQCNNAFTLSAVSADKPLCYADGHKLASHALGSQGGVLCRFPNNISVHQTLCSSVAARLIVLFVANVVQTIACRI